MASDCNTLSHLAVKASMWFVDRCCRLVLSLAIKSLHERIPPSLMSSCEVDDSTRLHHHEAPL
eukprot:749476-Amphidinium_carterae.1